MIDECNHACMHSVTVTGRTGPKELWQRAKVAVAAGHKFAAVAFTTSHRTGMTSNPSNMIVSMLVYVVANGKGRELQMGQFAMY